MSLVFVEYNNRLGTTHPKNAGNLWDSAAEVKSGNSLHRA